LLVFLHCELWYLFFSSNQTWNLDVSISLYLPIKPRT
jgi:hypothetical protein